RLELLGMGAIYAPDRSKTSQSMLFGRRNAHFDHTGSLSVMDSFLAVFFFGFFDNAAFDLVRHHVEFLYAFQGGRPEHQAQETQEKDKGDDDDAPVAPMGAESWPF